MPWIHARGGEPSYGDDRDGYFRVVREAARGAVDQPLERIIAPVVRVTSVRREPAPDQLSDGAARIALPCGYRATADALSYYGVRYAWVEVTCSGARVTARNDWLNRLRVRIAADEPRG